MTEIFKEGIRLYNAKNYEEALDAFLSQPDSTENPALEVAYYVGLSYAQLNKYDDALLYLEQVVTGGADPKRVNQCRLALAVIYSKTERTSLADFELKKLLESGYQTSDVYSVMAYEAWVRKEEENSVQYYEKALEINPESSTALNGLGYVLACMNRDLTKALFCCKRAVDKNPDSPAFLDSLGWVYYKLGLMAEARSFVKCAYDKAPSNPEISEHYTIVSTETHGPGGKEKASSQGGKK
ncbi:MAG: tetratricopeptide repeat protein [Spirochaetaceae bacterium]|nr:tetratricopeptide repeat protein [Spirochaetaceae bacterium]